MEDSVEARVSPEEVWNAWERAHQLHGQKGIEAGQKGFSQNAAKFKYQVLDVKKGESFSILWKTLFVRLVFTQRVKPTLRGSEIFYGVQIKGPFAWAVRWALGNKIKRNISLVLKSIVKQLEDQNARSK